MNYGAYINDLLETIASIETLIRESVDDLARVRHELEVVCKQHASQYETD